MLYVSSSSVREYANSGRLPYTTTPGGHRVFLEEDVLTFVGGTPEAESVSVAHYTRSSSGQDATHKTQKKLLETHLGRKPDYYIKDNASGLNENRKGLKKLVSLAKDGKINTITVTESDRLTRFGFSYLTELFLSYGVQVEVLHTAESEDLNAELMKDFMALIASFSGKFYRLRGWEQQKKLLDKAKASIDEKQNN